MLSLPGAVCVAVAPPPGPFTACRSIECGHVLPVALATLISTVSPTRARSIGPGTVPLKVQYVYVSPGATSATTSRVWSSTLTVVGDVRVMAGGTAVALPAMAFTVAALAAGSVFFAAVPCCTPATGAAGAATAGRSWTTGAAVVTAWIPPDAPRAATTSAAAAAMPMAPSSAPMAVFACDSLAPVRAWRGAWSRSVSPVIPVPPMRVEPESASPVAGIGRQGRRA